MNRHAPDFPCPICGGHSLMARGRGVRCAGFSLDFVSYCTRDEVSGRLPLDVSVSPAAYKHLLRIPCDCGGMHGVEIPQKPRTAFEPKTTLHVEVRDAIYSRLIEQLPFRDEAIADLERRGLPRWAAEAHGFRSLPQRGRQHLEIRDRLVREFRAEVLLRCPGLHDKNGNIGIRTTATGDAYLVPYRDEEGRITGLQIKYLGGKYQTPFGSVLAEVYCVAGPVRPGCDLWLTEGGTKAIVSAHLRPGTVFFGVAGQSLTHRHIDAVLRVNPRRVIVALDREVNANTDAARKRWIEALLSRTSVPVYDAVWEGAA